LLRKNVEPDQVICVTGTVGRAFAARVYFEYARSEGLKLEGRLEDELRMAWKRPKARVRESKIIRTHATACQDVSDGLKATIEQLVSAKLLGANIVEDALPIDESTRRVAEFYGIRPAQLAMSASVDFELLFTVPTWHLDSLLDEFGDRQLKVTKIGTTTNTGVCRLLCADGRVISPLPGMVWKSQFGDVIKDALKSEIHE
jgi:thiamine-monophosphate kinase